jgi:hypothetical protein
MFWNNRIEDMFAYCLSGQLNMFRGVGLDGEIAGFRGKADDNGVVILNAADLCQNLPIEYMQP